MTALRGKNPIKPVAAQYLHNAAQSTSGQFNSLNYAPLFMKIFKKIKNKNYHILNKITEHISNKICKLGRNKSIDNICNEYIKSVMYQKESICNVWSSRNTKNY